MQFLVTGGAELIGYALVNRLIRGTEHDAQCIEALSNAGGMPDIPDVLNHPRHCFLKVDINDGQAPEMAFDFFAPDVVLRLDAQTHVDRFTGNTRPFVASNINDTYTLLETMRSHLGQSPATGRRTFRNNAKWREQIRSQRHSGERMGLGL